MTKQKLYELQQQQPSKGNSKSCAVKLEDIPTLKTDFLGLTQNAAPEDTQQRFKSTESPNRLIPVPEWNQHHSWPPIGGLRHLIFNENTNGFASAFKRVGRRVLIDEKIFFSIIDKQNQGGEK